MTMQLVVSILIESPLYWTYSVTKRLILIRDMLTRYSTVSLTRDGVCNSRNFNIAQEEGHTWPSSLVRL